MKFGHQVEVNAECCGADRHGDTLVTNGKTMSWHSCLVLKSELN